MAKHTTEEMEQLSLNDLKKFAADPGQAEETPQSEPVQEDDEQPEIFVARRELDLGEGAGVEVFEAEGATEKEALENLLEKISDAKLNASRKIRQQEAELKDFRARTTEPPKPKTLTDDDEYVLAQEFGKKPGATFRKMFKEFTGYEVEDFASVKQAVDAVKTQQLANDSIQTFVASHPDYEDDPAKGGNKNGQMMRMKLAEMGLPVTSENLSKAYSQLKQSGLLLLKGEEAEPVTDGNAKESGRIVQPKVEPTQRVTKKSSTISTHNRTTATPANTEPSEDDAYNMPMEKLKQLANRQMSAR